MQSAETVLDVIRERGRRNLPLERLYRQLFNPQLHLMAYGRIYSNKGAMTPGATTETVDGMSMAKIEAIIDALRSETYRWTPTRRVYVEKKGSIKKRPLGLPTWSDKLVAEVVRLLLEAYYDVQFSDRSHGFRPGRGCHTALREVADRWKGTHWFIEGDISDCFGSLDHGVMLAILREKIHDGRFLRLIERMLKAGYLEDWKWNSTLSGAPQGGVLSPLLSNIYLDRLDQFIERELLPDYTRGKQRRANLEYRRMEDRIRRARQRGDRTAVRQLHQRQRSLPSGDPNDPGYRRLKYIRYADDWLLGFSGPKSEAQEIKSRIRMFLCEGLKLELSESKTLITHAATQAAHFLGYDLRAQHADTKITDGRRAVNGVIGLFVPTQAIQRRCAMYMKRGKPWFRGALTLDHDYTIVAKYQMEYRGFVQYYVLAQDVSRLDRLYRVMKTSLLKTLAKKHQSSIRKMQRRYKAIIDTPDGPRRCLQVTVERDGDRKPLVARFGAVPLKRQRTAKTVDRTPGFERGSGNELLHRLLAGACEMCESRVNLQVHHIRKLADLKRPGRPVRSYWAQLMARRRRKTLVVCQDCHQNIHAGRATSSPRRRSLESRVLGN